MKRSAANLVAKAIAKSNDEFSFQVRAKPGQPTEFGIDCDQFGLAVLLVYHWASSGEITHQLPILRQLALAQPRLDGIPIAQVHGQNL